MLLAAQMEAGKFIFKPESTDLAAFLQAIVDEFKTIYSETHAIDFDCRFAGMALIDTRLVRQIATNLISNALKYSPVNSQVCITLDSIAEHYVLIVQDHGIGIPAADQEHLFEAFERGANVGKVPGSGIGLATVQQAVEWHGGAITFVSKEGVGTTFTVVLPQHYPDAAPDKT